MKRSNKNRGNLVTKESPTFMEKSGGMSRHMERSKGERIKRGRKGKG